MIVRYPNVFICPQSCFSRSQKDWTPTIKMLDSDWKHKTEFGIPASRFGSVSQVEKERKPSIELSVVSTSLVPSTATSQQSWPLNIPPPVQQFPPIGSWTQMASWLMMLESPMSAMKRSSSGIQTC